MKIVPTLLILVGCGSATGPLIPDAEVISLTSIAVTPGTITTKYGLDSPTQLVATANLSNGTTTDISSRVTWSSSSDLVVTVSDLGLMTPRTSGSAMVTATLNGTSGASSVTVVAPTLVIGEFSPSGIDFFSADASGDTAPFRSIRPTTAPLGLLREIAIHGNELYVVDQTNNAIVVYPLSASGDAVPTRKIAGNLTTISNPYAIAFHNDDLYVADATGVAVFPSGGTGNINVSPSRTISGLSSACGLEVLNDELYVLTLNSHTISVFPADANGAAQPSRVITMTTPYSTCGLRLHKGEIFVGNQESQVITVFDASATGSSVPIRAISGTQVGLQYTEQTFVLGNELYVPSAENNTIQVYDVESTGNVAPKRSIVGGTTLLADPIGIAMY